LLWAEAKETVGGRISESTIREIREKADIVSVVSETVPLSRSGASFRGLCPFHREKTPSFFVHPSRQIFHCFGCGEGGSVYHFLMKARSLTFTEAVESLGERYGVPVRYEDGAPRKKPGDDLYRILDLAARTFRDLLRSSAPGKAARDFLRRRGVTPEAEQEFALGYGGQGKDLLAALEREGIPPDRAARAGLLLSREEGGYRERFRGRAIFPVTDSRGRICGFGARALDDAMPKYLNSPESEVYRKSALLYGLFQALRPIREEKKVVVVEGYMDLIALWQRGVRNVVATCGTSLTEPHARLMKRLSDTVILLFDGDVAGKRSAVRAGGPLYAAGLSPLVLFPPKGMDPDDWAKETSGDELAGRIGQAEPLMEYIDRAAARKHDLAKIAGKLSYLGLMGKYLAWITDPAEERLYVQKVARATGLPEETVLARLKGSRGTPPAPPPEESRTGSANPQEELLLELLCRDPSLVLDVVRDGLAERIEGKTLREIVALLHARAGGAGAPEIADLLDAAGNEEIRGLLSEGILRGASTPGDPRALYADVSRRLRIRALDRDVARLAEASKEAGRAGLAQKAQELFAAQVAAKNEKERLERERNDAGAR
jgi:DNA primase